MGTKIQINSLEALERLIGNDNELEIEIRNSVVQYFTKQHLKDIANTELMDNYSRAVVNEVTKNFFVEIGGSAYRKGQMFFNQDILDKIKRVLIETANKELLKIVLEVVEQQKNLDTIQKEIEKASNFISEQLTEKILQDKIEKLVDERIKEKLGLK